MARKKPSKSLDEEFKQLTLIDSMNAFQAVVELAKRHNTSVPDMFFSLSHINQHLALDAI